LRWAKLSEVIFELRSKLSVIEGRAFSQCSPFSPFAFLPLFNSAMTSRPRWSAKADKSPRFLGRLTHRLAGGRAFPWNRPF
jgi:hypothetical protein